jgi:chromosomal replication initiation ATPase DnaA
MLTIHQIMRQEARAAGLTYEDLVSYDASQRVSHVRQRAMWRARHETNKSFKQIGLAFKRDHTTVITGIKNHEKRNSHFSSVID